MCLSINEHTVRCIEGCALATRRRQVVADWISGDVLP